MKISLRELKSKLNWSGLPKKDKLMLGLLALALLALVLSCVLPSGGTKNNDADMVSAKAYKSELEKQLSAMLGKVNGVGTVSVMVTLEGESSREIAYNESVSSTISSGNTAQNQSRDAVLVRDSTQTAPYTLRDLYPKVIGVLVVADGAEDPETRSYIVSAIKTTLDVTANNIVVLPMGAEGRK